MLLSEKVFYIEICLFAIVILLLLSLGIKNKRALLSADEANLYKILLFINIAILACDSICAGVNGVDTYFSRVLNNIFMACYYLLTPFLSFFYLLYCDKKIEPEAKTLSLKNLIVLAFIFINAVLSILSIWFPIYFVISNENIYLRSILFFLTPIICYGIIIFNLINLLLHKKMFSGDFKSKRTLQSLLFFPLPTLIGGVLQYYFYTFPSLFISTVVSLFIMFINIQNSEIATDSLTGLYNRNQLIPFLERKIKKPTKKILSILLIDINDFKKINDTFGHLIGDSALTETAKILTYSCKTQDVIGRFGGDEFIIIAERATKKEIKTLIKNINNNISYFNENENVKYSLSLGIGYAIWNEGYDIDKFIASADASMYENKNQTKAKKEIG